MFSDPQKEAIAKASALLCNAGVILNDMSLVPVNYDSPPGITSNSASSITTQLLNLPTPPPLEVSSANASQISLEPSVIARPIKVNHKLILEKLFDHPLGSIIEYPITAHTPDGAVGH
ncbi:hypothetical protein BDQ17DRAFT_1438200 [Cyathus striatus]|nr:hypothetical protein BDQ17DRAFT_1438200 [Cyathus striatus]